MRSRTGTGMAFMPQHCHPARQFENYMFYGNDLVLSLSETVEFYHNEMPLRRSLNKKPRQHLPAGFENIQSD